MDKITTDMNTTTAVESSAESNVATIISTKDPATMSDEERQTEATLLLERLKALRSTPRSDWHRGFEDVLQVKLSSWGVKYRIHHEVTLGEDAPRIDYLVVMLEDMPAIVEKAFKHFRKQDIIEYKRPGDTINRPGSSEKLMAMQISTLALHSTKAMCQTMRCPSQYSPTRGTTSYSQSWKQREF